MGPLKVGDFFDFCVCEDWRGGRLVNSLDCVVTNFVISVDTV